MPRDVDLDKDKQPNKGNSPDKEPEKNERNESRKVQKDNKDEWKTICDVKQMLNERRQQWIHTTHHEPKRELTSDEKKLVERAITIEKNRIKDDRKKMSEINRQIEALSKDDPKRSKLESQQVKLDDRIKQADRYREFFKNELDLNREYRIDKITSKETPIETKDRCEREAFSINSKLKIIDRIQDDYYRKATTRTNEDRINVVMDVCRYQGKTNIHVGSVAMEQLKQLHVEVLKEKYVPKQELEKVATMKYSAGVRTFYERGLRIGKESPKPEQMNNAIRALNMIQKDYPDVNDVRNTSAKKEVVNWICQSKIQNVRMSDNDLRTWVDKLEKDGLERETIRKRPEEARERDEKNNTLRQQLLDDPRNFISSAKDALLSSNEKLDIQSLVNMRNEAQSKLPKGEKLQPIELKTEEVRQIFLCKNAELLPNISKIGISLPLNTHIDKSSYEKSLNDINRLKEKNDVMKVAILTANNAIMSEIRDKDDKKVSVPLQILNKKDEEKMQKVLPDVKKAINAKDKDERTEIIKQAREDLKKISKEQKEKENYEARLEKGWQLPYSIPLYGMPIEVSRGVSTMLQRENYNPVETREKLDKVKDMIKQQQDYNGLTLHDAKMRERALDDRTVILAASKDPQLLIDMQRIGFNISKNGAFNEERLRESITKMERVPANEVNLRMAILEKHYVTDKKGAMGLKNPFNMGTREDTKDVKNLALYLHAKENNLKFEKPKDDGERSRLEQNIEKLEKYEKSAKFERQLSYDVKEKYQSDNGLYGPETRLSLALNDRDYELKIKETASKYETLSKSGNISSDRSEELKSISNALNRISQMTSPDIYKTREDDRSAFSRVETKDGAFSPEPRIIILNSYYKNEDKNNPLSAQEKIANTFLNSNDALRDTTSEKYLQTKEVIDKLNENTEKFEKYLSEIRPINGQTEKINITNAPVELVRSYFSGERELEKCAYMQRDGNVQKSFDPEYIREAERNAKTDDEKLNVLAMKAEALNSCNLLNHQLGVVIDGDRIFISESDRNFSEIGIAYDTLEYRIEKAFPYVHDSYETIHDRQPAEYSNINAHFGAEKELLNIAKNELDKYVIKQDDYPRTDDRHAVILGDERNGISETTLYSSYLERVETDPGRIVPNDKFLDLINSGTLNNMIDAGIRYEVHYPSTNIPNTTLTLNYDIVSASLLNEKDIDILGKAIGSKSDFIATRMEDKDSGLRGMHNDVLVKINDYYEKFIEKEPDIQDKKIYEDSVNSAVDIINNIRDYSFGMMKHFPSLYEDKDNPDPNTEKLQEVLENARHNFSNMLYESFGEDMLQDVLDRYGSNKGNTVITIIQNRQDEIDRIQHGLAVNGDDGIGFEVPYIGPDEYYNDFFGDSF